MKMKRYNVVGAVVLILILLGLSTSLVWAIAPSIKVYKYDAATGEPIEGWHIRIYKQNMVTGDWIFVDEKWTGPDGSVTFTDLPLIPWRIWEEERECWEAVAPDGIAWWENGYYIDVDPRFGAYPVADIIFMNEYGCTPPPSPGTGTPGYWKNHPDAWPVDMITIGGVTYSKEDAISTLNMPERGDKTYTMFRALVAAKLNVLIENDDSCIAETIAAADEWMMMYGPAGSGVRANSDAWDEGEPLANTLDAYNNGELCAPARD